jgi:hypothetical protein
MAKVITVWEFNGRPIARGYAKWSRAMPWEKKISRIVYATELW